VIENKGSASDFVRAVRAIRQVDCTCGHLRGEAEQVLCDSSARLDSPTEFARERLCHLVEVWAQFCREHLTELGAIIDSTNHPANGTFALQTMECRVDRRAASEVGDVPCGKRPSSSVAVNPAKSFFFGRSVSHRGLILQEKIPLFSCKSKGRNSLRVPKEWLSTAPLSHPTYSPFRFNNLRPGEVVLYRVSGEPNVPLLITLGFRTARPSMPFFSGSNPPWDRTVAAC
jgi:hypothetical protein